ncbi:MAG: twin-arginine translocation signal domain-containing protein [Clostridiaceae bacterium]|nr:twin-arginine translocation signal domain-containing protein [Clostridiaceae bacterium]
MSEQKNLSRRNFLKGAAVGAAGLATFGIAGCVNSASSTQESPISTTQESVTVTKTLAQVAQINSNWLENEPDITDISETITCEALVIGGGTGGLECGAALAERGLDTLIIEQNADVSTLRNDWGAIGSKYQLEKGTIVDNRAVINYHIMQNSGRFDQRLQKNLV